MRFKHVKDCTRCNKHVLWNKGNKELNLTHVSFQSHENKCFVNFQFV